MKESRYSKVRIVQEGERIVIEASSPESRHAFLWEYNQKSGKLTPLGAELSKPEGKQIEQLLADLKLSLAQDRADGGSAL